MSDRSGGTKTKVTRGRTTVVIGAGIVGLIAALELQRRGHHVRLLDIGPPGGAQSASYGHGAWINPASIMPTSVPGLWKQVPGFLKDPVGPFYLSVLDLPGLAPWLLRFLWAGRSWENVEACARSRYALSRSAVDLHARLAAEAGVSDLLRREGLVTVYRRREDFLRGRKEAELREKLGIALSEIGAEELRDREPDLADHYTFGACIADGAYLGDTAGYCRGLAKLLADRGGEVLNGRAIGFAFDGDRLAGVETDNSFLTCDKAVVAAGVRSAALARVLGDRIPLASERGYHVQVTGASVSPRHTVILSDGKVAISAQTPGFRVAGQVELAPIDKRPNWKRADIMLHHARRGLPGLDPEADGIRIDRWMGHRPSTPDSLPVIGYSRRSRDVVYAFGHGHAGPSQSPMTALIVGALANGERPDVDPAPYAPQRFGLTAFA